MGRSDVEGRTAAQAQVWASEGQCRWRLEGGQWRWMAVHEEAQGIYSLLGTSALRPCHALHEELGERR